MLFETVRLGLRSVRRNALRSFLTLLGIVIGVAAVIAMVTIGSGTTEKVKQDISQLGSNLLVVRPARPDRSGSTNFTPRKLGHKDVATLVTGLSGARAVSAAPEAATSARVRSATCPSSVRFSSVSASKWSSMARLDRPVTNTKSSMPAARASSTACWSSGRSTSGIISLGIAFVAGRKRVPSPATGNTTLRTRLRIGSLILVQGPN